MIPEELFAAKAPAPDFRLLSFRKRLYPRARNHYGGDATEALLEVDERYGNRFEPDRRFPGRASGVHALELDFGAGGIRGLLAPEGQPASGGRRGTAHPYLCLYGFVEYGYSTSNFAAAQARADFKAPSVLVERQGRWVPLREEWGFPAGYPRYMAVDLAGLLEDADRRVRIETNLDIHWDEAFLADASSGGGLAVRELAASSAKLLFRGFPRAERPAGVGPVRYFWEGFQALAPFKVFPGAYTRYGEVGELLDEADDRMAVLGPGDGLSLRFPAAELGPPAPGTRRTFLAKVVGYCKDMDLYTGASERVEPLPFRAMSAYPYPEGERPAANAAWEQYQRLWNTRRVEGRYLDGFDGLGR